MDSCAYCRFCQYALDHVAWCRYHQLPMLTDSLNVAPYKDKFFKFDQLHFVGDKDRVIPPILTHQFLDGSTHKMHLIEGATHADGWDEVVDYLRQ